MLKLTGLLLLFSSCALFGYGLSAQLGERALTIRRTMDFLQQFSLQLDCLRAPPAQLVRLLVAQQEFAGDSFLIELGHAFDGEGSFKLALQRALQKNPQLERWGLAPVLLPLGDAIGVRELETQLGAITSAVLALQGLLRIAQREAEQKGGLYRKLGVFSGLLLVLVLY